MSASGSYADRIGITVAGGCDVLAVIRSFSVSCVALAVFLAVADLLGRRPRD